MIFLDHSFVDPGRNLALDEALLNECNKKSFNALRIWESDSHFVVLGSGNKIKEEVDEKFCKENNIPILRRCSGGGTVVQGPGCLNYAFILDINSSDDLKTISSTTSHILNKQKLILNSLVDNIDVKGISDLVVQENKFSGNAQRRLKNSLLFHGTILYDFNSDIISQCLKHPPKEPEYRKNRPHHSFVKNLNVPRKDLVSYLKSGWAATRTLPDKIMTEIHSATKKLSKEKYDNKEWTYKR